MIKYFLLSIILMLMPVTSSFSKEKIPTSQEKVGFSQAKKAASKEKIDISKVTVGIFIEGISVISYVNNSFNVDFTLWFKWKDKDIHPDKTFKLKHGKISSKKVVYSGVLPETNEKIEIIDISAVIDSQWNIYNFPFDNQTLKIEVEDDDDNPNTQTEFVQDTKNIQSHKNISFATWKIRDEKTFISSNQFPSTYGKPHVDIETQVSTQLNHYIEIEKKSELIGLKLIVAPSVAILLMLFVVFLPAIEAPRLTVPSSALFILVSSSYIITNIIPNSEGYSFADKLISLGILQCLIHLIITVISIKLFKQGKVEASILIDRILFISCAILNIGFTAYTVYVIAL